MTGVRRAVTRGLGWGLGLVLLISACAPAATAPGASPGSPGAAAAKGVDVLRIAGGDWGYPSPYTFVRGPGWVDMSLSFDTLVWKDSEKIVPWLATEWSSSADGLKWSFTLRDNVKWHDGTPFTADDVAFTIEYFKKNVNSWYAGKVDLIKAVTVTDPKHVEITLTTPYAPFLESVAGGLVIIPKHIWSAVTDPKKLTGPEAVIGTGPYKLTSYDKTTGSYLYEANPDFFLGPPYVKRIEMVPTANELVALAKGDIDAGGPGVQDAATDEVLAPFADKTTYGMLTAPGEWTMGLYFNLGKRGALADKAFRKAAVTAIDRGALLERIAQGRGRVGNPGYLPISNPWHNPKVEQYPFDVAKAKAALDAAGYLDKGGSRVDKDGKPLQLELLYANNDSPRNAELIVSFLKAVGIGVTAKAVDRPTRDAAATAGRYELILTGFGGLGADPDNMRGAFSSKSKVKSFTRVQGYANPAFDALADQQLSTVDPAARRKLTDQMQEIIADDVPMIGLYYPDRYYIYKKGGLENWFYTVGGMGGGVPTALNKALLATGKKTLAK
jgi:peptide/nickel transport system substrate-binding protein